MALSMRLAVAVLFCAACTPPGPPPGAAGPLEAVQSFSAAAQKGDTATAWSLLSVRTRAAADAQAAAAGKQTGKAEPESGRQMLFGSALPQGKLEAKLLDEKGDEAHVALGAKRYRVVRENDRWHVDLDLSTRDGGDTGPRDGGDTR